MVIETKGANKADFFQWVALKYEQYNITRSGAIEFSRTFLITSRASSQRSVHDGLLGANHFQHSPCMVTYYLN